MSNLSGGEIFFYGGIAVMALAVLAAIAALVIFSVTGRRLRQKLTEEFGEKGR